MQTIQAVLQDIKQKMIVIYEAGHVYEIPAEALYIPFTDTSADAIAPMDEAEMQASGM